MSEWAIDFENSSREGLAPHITNMTDLAIGANKAITLPIDATKLMGWNAGVMAGAAKEMLKLVIIGLPSVDCNPIKSAMVSSPDFSQPIEVSDEVFGVNGELEA